MDADGINSLIIHWQIKALKGCQVIKENLLEACQFPLIPAQLKSVESSFHPFSCSGGIIFHAFVSLG
jgi:hypothetical protein